MNNPTSSASYDVFISFRGQDTRKCFVGNLYEKLCEITQAKIFFDDRKIVPGDSIDETLKNAIRESRIGLVVFSKNYASSTYCLDELAMIVERSIDQKRMTFLPVFYEVEPHVLRHQKESYEEAFTKHEARYEMKKIQQWRTALNKAAGIAGYTSSNYKYDSDLIIQIAKFIIEKMEKIARQDAKDKELASVYTRSQVMQKIKNWRNHYNKDTKEQASTSAYTSVPTNNILENKIKHKFTGLDIAIAVAAERDRLNRLELLKTLEPNPYAIEKTPEGTPGASGGVLVVYIPYAQDVEGKHHTNPYAQLTFQGKQFITTQIENNRYPLWDTTFEFTLEEPPTNDRLYVEVLSTSSKHPKETLGYLDINLSDVVSNKTIDQNYRLIDSKNGRIRINLQWRTPVPRSNRNYWLKFQRT